jgi:hypothetical protein
MGMDIWFKEDIANILRAADEANLSALAAGEDVCMAGVVGGPTLELRGAYRRGFVAALVTLALALGLPPPIMDGNVKSAMAQTVTASRVLPPW